MVKASDLKARISPTNYLRRAVPNMHLSAYRDEISVKCPFHPDKHPSMSINLRTGQFCCHAAACGVHGGDIIAFEMLRYGLDFRGALEKIAQEWGIY